jgi:hypothetical protein
MNFQVNLQRHLAGITAMDTAILQVHPDIRAQRRFNNSAVSQRRYTGAHSFVVSTSSGDLFLLRRQTPQLQTAVLGIEERQNPACLR